MAKNKPPLTAEQKEKVLADLRKDVSQRNSGYRAQALKLFPHICASCAREFSGARLKELTVHHKDHNHQNNPPDGSNWELLCLYCHDHEHEKMMDAKFMNPGTSSSAPTTNFASPFESLGAAFEGESE